MKLTLKASNNIDILEAHDAISDRDVQVLGAGIKRLMVSGKNKIILDLTLTTGITSDAIRAIGQFDFAARELAGRVYVCGANPQIMKQIQGFATPPILAIFPDVKTAVAEFLKVAKAVDDGSKVKAAPVAAAPAAPAAKPTPSTAPKPELKKPAPAQATPSSKKPDSSDVPADHETAAKIGSKEGLTRDEIIEREKSEVTALREKIIDLEGKSKILHEQIHLLTMAKKQMPNEAAYQDKTKTLEHEIAQLLEQIKNPPAAAAGGAPAKK